MEWVGRGVIRNKRIVKYTLRSSEIREQAL